MNIPSSSKSYLSYKRKLKLMMKFFSRKANEELDWETEFIDV